MQLRASIGIILLGSGVALSERMAGEPLGEVLPRLQRFNVKGCDHTRSGGFMSCNLTPKNSDEQPDHKSLDDFCSRFYGFLGCKAAPKKGPKPNMHLDKEMPLEEVRRHFPNARTARCGIDGNMVSCDFYDVGKISVFSYSQDSNRDL
ncbi:uncharacterized protein MAM_06921 [Metarhizium album ARSEF 1941]|uniref:Uncharacterized protein n=1 Tax=Metarhizium album (strain ARSEF 1941) TaxID=1081103 RepID=A0A0B2WQD9_METAS|nr:uncharacterized protein MAM_06921 [Metarhizium album ARSEF 1941]KHN95210.1 hypothetical protein MAM_06921 [Metarhizium album ARSEF 1941]